MPGTKNVISCFVHNLRGDFFFLTGKRFELLFTFSGDFVIFKPESRGGGVMNADKVREVLAVYRKKFEELNISKRQFPHNELPKSDNDFLAHCHRMLDEMEVFIRDGRMEKVFRWLGFIQGCLWKIGVYTIEEMKNHNRS